MASMVYAITLQSTSTNVDDKNVDVADSVYLGGLLDHHKALEVSTLRIMVESLAYHGFSFQHAEFLNPKVAGRRRRQK